jgi:2-polyprenyl-3-methyl-5-hydroxy-6-metoxy-1,4-benzoquinol methylase
MTESRIVDPADARYVVEQYKGATRLEARRRSYDAFAEPGRPSLMSWIVRQLELRRGMRILEVGCGSGSLWQENMEHLPSDLEITLSDNAEAMLRVARQRLGTERFRYLCCDVETTCNGS